MDKIKNRIRNLSVRKTILLYMSVTLVCSFSLSSYISVLAWHTQAGIWRKYADIDEHELAGYNSVEEYVHSIEYTTDVRRPASYEMSPHDRHVSELCDFLQTYTVLILSMAGSCAAVFLFYRNKLKCPILELTTASENIRRNNLNFHITYENKDEMGQLCREFERMRAQLAENNILLWRSVEEERALRAAIAHDIRSPLSVLKGYHEMLTDYLPNESIGMEKAMEMLSECGKQLDRMDKFVETMRKLSSLERRELCSDELTAEQLQADLLAEISIFAKEADKKILLHTSSTGESFRGDKEIILEVTENLLSNALRYAKREVNVALSLSDSECQIRVTDDGTGFLKAPLKSVKDSLKHAGIGMYICRLYCEKHGGRLLSGNLQQGGASVTAIFRRIG